MSQPSSALLSALPLFPLGTVLFPDGLLPLNIFEVRYLDMVGKCHKAGAPFGVVSLTAGAEVRRPGATVERFAEVGTLALIQELHAPQAGLLQIVCQGTQRFRVRTTELQKHGLWTAEVERLPDDLPLELPDDLRHTAVALRRLHEALQQRQDAPRVPVAEPCRYDDCGWVANRWSELLPLPAARRQQLMQLDSPLMRLELVSDLLGRSGISA